MSVNDKKTEQLGMNVSTASARLRRSLMWGLLKETGNIVCYRCGENMCESTYSIEHTTPWLDSENPVELFFDINNISYSHLACNSRAARRGKGYTPEQRLKARRDNNRKSWTPEKRREYYEKTGK